MTALVRDAAADVCCCERLGAHEVVERVEGGSDLMVDAVGGAAFGRAISMWPREGLS